MARNASTGSFNQSNIRHVRAFRASAYSGGLAHQSESSAGVVAFDASPLTIDQAAAKNTNLRGH
jgi:hypothetical protein